MTLLRHLGIDPNDQPVRETVALVRDHSRWEHAGQPFFAGEVEPCINGRTVAIGAYFGVDADRGSLSSGANLVPFGRAGLLRQPVIGAGGVPGGAVWFRRRRSTCRRS